MPIISRRNTKSGKIQERKQELALSLTANGAIVCPIDLTDEEYDSIFSKQVLRTQLEVNKFLFTAGSLADLVNFSILHSGFPELGMIQSSTVKPTNIPLF